MLRVRVALLLAIALTSVACVEDVGPLPSVPTPAEAHAAARVRDFLDAVRPLVGDAPLECNSNLRRWEVPRVGTPNPAALAEWFDCAQSARAARRPFLVVLEQPPFEGWHLTGVLGRPDGSVRAFSYYEGCCWPPTPSLKAGVCQSPAVRGDHGGFYGLHCANEDRSGFVRMPEHWLREAPLSPDLADWLRRFTGGDAIDCGLEVSASMTRPGYSPYFVREAFECATATKASGRAFHLLLQQRGVRSTIVVGLIGTPAGSVSRFRYDSAPCGGHGCGSSFEAEPCDRPTLAEPADIADIVCQPSSTFPEPRSRRHPAP